MNKAFLDHFLAHLTHEPGVYRMLDAEAQVIYVGKATNLKKRVSSYFTKQNVGTKTRALVNQIESIEVSITRSETEALLLESNLIKSLRPRYNVIMRDDKTYPFIHVSSHPSFPRIEIIRFKKKPKQGCYFGPFPNVNAVRQTLNTIQKVFKIRNCSDSYFNSRSRPCLQYQIQRCSAPCTNYISNENYQKSIADAIKFLQGKSQQILDELTERMQQAVNNLAFEEAARIRDQIKSLRQVQEQQGVTYLRGDADVIVIEAQPGFACIQCVTIREGEVIASERFFPDMPTFAMDDSSSLWQQVFEAFITHRYLDVPERIPNMIITNQTIQEKQALQTILSQASGKSCQINTSPRGIKIRWLDFALNNLRLSITEHNASINTLNTRYQALAALLRINLPIKRMECFDISHTQGESTIASCVVFDAQGPRKRDYRRFNILGITPGDDYAALEQAILRRFKRLSRDNNFPDILIIDGGKGQVSTAKRVLDMLGIYDVELIGIAKGPDRKAGWERLILVNQGKEITLPSASPALLLLQQIRDEAHRFAITTHQKKRQKTSFESSLSSLTGIGPKRRQALLQRFGGIRDLAKASIDEIAKVNGISAELAMRIYQHFH